MDPPTTELVNGPRGNAERRSVSSAGLINSCGRFLKDPSCLGGRYQFANLSPADAFTAFCNLIDGTPIPRKELVRLSCFLRSLASEVEHGALLEELAVAEVSARVQRLRGPDLLAEFERFRAYAAVPADQRISRLEIASQRADDRLEFCGLLRQLAGIGRSPVGLIQQLTALGRGNPHLTGLLRVDASSSLGTPPYVVADLDSPAVFSSAHDAPNQWIRYRFKTAALPTGYHIWNPTWLAHWEFQVSASGEGDWKAVHTMDLHCWPKTHHSWQIDQAMLKDFPGGCRGVRILRPPQPAARQDGPEWIHEAKRNGLVLKALEIYGYFINDP
jgi:hypothetical protein